MPEIQEPKKIIIEYQHTMEDGTPILDPRTRKPIFTNLVGDTLEEIIEKQKKQNIEVTRALNRARNFKPIPKSPEPAAVELTPEEERQAAADLQDPTKARAAARKLTGVDSLEEQVKVAKQKQDNADALTAQLKFMSSHLADYYPCKANSDLMWGFINQEGLDPKEPENYEIAFNAIQGQLARRPAPPIPAAAPIQQEEPPKRKAEIQPGQLSGQRPAPKPKGITKEDIKKMRATAEGRAEYSRRMRDPKFVAEVDALFAAH